MISVDVYFLMEYVPDCLLVDTDTGFNVCLLQRCYWSDMFTGRLRSEIPPALVKHLFHYITVKATLKLPEPVAVFNTFPLLSYYISNLQPSGSFVVVCCLTYLTVILSLSLVL